MTRYLNTAIRMVFITLILFGVIYPLVITGIAQLLFPRQANGSLLEHNGKLVGSALLGQPFARPEYFHPRPSAAGNGYDPMASGGSNFAPTSAALSNRVTVDIAHLTQENPTLNPAEIPVDMVTASASGLDPDITLANADAQAARIAAARGTTPARIRQLIDEQTLSRQFGILGEPRINVLSINLALDARIGQPHTLVAER